MLNVVCFLWGDWPFGFQYVKALKNMVSRNLTEPHSFTCFTNWELENNNQDTGIKFRKLPNEVVSLRGNLPKLYMYSKLSGLSGRVVCMDLDSVIVSNIDDILSYTGDWCGVYQIRYEKQGSPNPTHAGGLVSFDHEKCFWIWDKLVEAPTYLEKYSKGKEREAMRILFTENGFEPDHWNYPKKHPQFNSYKGHIRKLNNNKLFKDSGFVAFHGQPRPHEVMNISWVKEHWR